MSCIHWKLITYQMAYLSRCGSTQPKAPNSRQFVSLVALASAMIPFDPKSYQLLAKYYSKRQVLIVQELSSYGHGRHFRFLLFQIPTRPSSGEIGFTKTRPCCPEIFSLEQQIKVWIWINVFFARNKARVDTAVGLHSVNTLFFLSNLHRRSIFLKQLTMLKRVCMVGQILFLNVRLAHRKANEKKKKKKLIELRRNWMI